MLYNVNNTKQADNCMYIRHHADFDSQDSLCGMTLERQTQISNDAYIGHYASLHQDIKTSM